jgi:diguanylate cyclase (GGDEF)-like protein
MREKYPVLPVAALIAVILLLLTGILVRSVNEPAGAAGVPREAIDVGALPPGPVDLEALPGPHPSVRPRRLLAGSALAIGVVLLVVHFGWPRKYILEWVTCWVLGACGMLLLSRRYPDPRFARAAIGVFSLTNLAAALIWLKSGWSYARQPLPRATRWILALLVVWLVGGRLLLPRQLMATTYFLVLAIVSGATALKFVVGQPHGRSLGAVALGVGLSVVAGSNLVIAFSIPSFTSDGVLVFRILAVNALALAVAAVGMHLLIFEDTTRELRLSNDRLASAQERMRQLAITDQLTGCYNRRFFDEVAPRELERQRRYSQPLSVMFIDVDHFKQINDTRGHHAGDRVLQRVAAVLREHLRQSDYIFRWGGDEFVALLGCDAAEAARKAATLKLALAGPHADGPVGVSAGVVEVGTSDTDLLAAITAADERMYQDKLMKANIEAIDHL